MSKKKVSRYVMSSSDNQIDRLRDALEKLELSGITDAFMEVARRSREHRESFLDFLESLLCEQMSWKEERRILRRCKQAKFPAMKGLPRFDFRFPHKIDQDQVMDLASCDFIKEAKNVVFLGPSGVGKTHLSIAIGIEAIHRGYEVRFITLRDFIESVEKAQSAEKAKGFLEVLNRNKLLIFDDMDYYETSQDTGMLLFKLLMDRYEKSSVIFTSNRPYQEWETLFGNKNRAMAIIDRLLHHAETVTILGESYRLKDRKKKPGFINLPPMVPPSIA